MKPTTSPFFTHKKTRGPDIGHTHVTKKQPRGAIQKENFRLGFLMSEGLGGGVLWGVVCGLRLCEWALASRSAPPLQFTTGARVPELRLDPPHVRGDHRT